MIDLDRKAFASNEKYSLYSLIDEEREMYYELFKKRAMERNLDFDEKYLKLMWNSLHEIKSRVYSIYDNFDNYCGYIELDNPTSDTPEIGIEIAVDFRNKGIAPSIVPIFIKAVCEQQFVEYFEVKIYKTNSHSRHVFEKLGAEFVKEEKSEINDILKQTLDFVEKDYEKKRNRLENTDDTKMNDKDEKILELYSKLKRICSLYDNDVDVCVYKLFPYKFI